MMIKSGTLKSLIEMRYHCYSLLMAFVVTDVAKVQVWFVFAVAQLRRAAAEKQNFQ